MQFVKKHKLAVFAFAALLVVALATAAFAGFTYDLNGDTANAPLQTPGAITASGGSTTSMNLAGYEGAVKVVLYSAACTGTNPSMTAKVQTSPDNSTWTDTGITFTAVQNATAMGTSSSLQSVGVDTRTANQYIRLYYTMSGTSPSCTAAAYAEGEKQYRGPSYQ